MSGNSDLAKLRWRCRRGTKELDVLTTRYLEHFYSEAEDQEKQAFATLLELQDPQLYKLLSGEQAAHDVWQQNIIKKIHSI